MMATAALLPSPVTSDKAMFNNQLDHIVELVQAETGLPLYGVDEHGNPVTGGKGGGGAAKPAAGKKVIVVTPEDMK
jgi:hypothetical protein